MVDSVPVGHYYRPAVANTAEWAGREAARTAVPFRSRVVATFRAPPNLAYLRALFGSRVPAGPLRVFALETLHDAAYTFTEDEGRGLDVLASDPVAQRGGARPALDLWAEVRRLNRAFFEDRLAFLRDSAHLIERRAPRDGISEDDEPYHMRMFTADSLRPPGLEHLNGAGPLYAIREEQSFTTPGPPGRGDASSRRETFAVAPSGDVPDTHQYNEDDAPWSRGDANRTPEQAVNEYYGDSHTASETAIGGPELMGLTYGSVYSWGNGWKDNGGTRAQRYPQIPFWQKLSREGVDRDIEETLGLASRELDAHVRRWDMSRVRDPRGQEYRRYGPRSSGAL